CSMVVCAAAQRALDLSSYESLALHGGLAIDEPGHPAGAASEGFVPGEGVVVLLLKRLSEARRDGDPIHGIVRGLGMGSDANQFEAAPRQAVRRALDESGHQPAELQLVEAGMNLPACDAVERAVLDDVLTDGAQGRALPVASPVASIGHLQAAQGLVLL